MIKRAILNLRHKPKPVRDRIALGIASGVTALVVMVWMYHLPTKLASITEKSQKSGEERGFASLFSEVGDQIATVKESFSDVTAENGESASGTNPNLIEGYEEYWPERSVEKTVVTSSSTEPETVSEDKSSIKVEAGGQTLETGRAVRISTTSATSVSSDVN